MEKDNFKDRSYAYKYNNLLQIGDKVLICEKHMQKTAKEMSDLTCGTIVRKLTSAPDHPRGIKVEIKVDKFFPNSLKTNKEFAIGRVVYLIDKNTNIILVCDRS